MNSILPRFPFPGNGAGVNSYNDIVTAPSVIQPVPVGDPEIVTFDTPPAVEYANHFRHIEDLEAYLESLKYVPIQRPSENFIFTESADNYYYNKDSCPFCERFFPSDMTQLDRGRHAFKICPYRPVQCRRSQQMMMAKDYLYLHMFTLLDPVDEDARRAGVWAWSNAVKRDRDLRLEAEERAERAELLVQLKQEELESLSRVAADTQLSASAVFQQPPSPSEHGHGYYRPPSPGRYNEVEYFREDHRRGPAANLFPPPHPYLVQMQQQNNHPLPIIEQQPYFGGHPQAQAYFRPTSPTMAVPRWRGGGGSPGSPLVPQYQSQSIGRLVMGGMSRGQPPYGY
eukprot:TRINITY_DN7026_c0_g1_i1.p1 TRINITY_DN7026_c0_g1~~TRINITY_DN7026_c0_g1_i1.p1  ORF type:complete len:354 (+),score=41.51 TRINITY_DN7026_c0_g1_i1:42-1064(+)